MNHKVATAQILELLAKTNTPASLSTEDLIIEIKSRLEPGIAVRITDNRVTVSHSRYCNNLKTASDIRAALATNQWIKCEAA